MSAEKKVDALPNILICGTPGAGKSYLCQRVAEQLNLNWLECSKLAREQQFVVETDDEYECPILDEDKLLDYMEPIMQAGGNVVEYHGCELFPERWFDAVFVVTCSNTLLYDRLQARNYNATKLAANVQCEIFGVILEEARDSYKQELVHVLKGDTKQDGANSLKTIKSWYRAWKKT